MRSECFCTGLVLRTLSCVLCEYHGECDLYILWVLTERMHEAWSINLFLLIEDCMLSISLVIYAAILCLIVLGISGNCM